MLNYLRDPENNSKSLLMEASGASCAPSFDKLIIALLVPVLSGPWTAPSQQGASSLPPSTGRILEENRPERLTVFTPHCTDAKTDAHKS